MMVLERNNLKKGNSGQENLYLEKISKGKIRKWLILERKNLKKDSSEQGNRKESILERKNLKKGDSENEKSEKDGSGKWQSEKGQF